MQERQLELNFSGSNYKPSVDRPRLKRQFEIIFDLMKDGLPRTLFQIRNATGFSEASVSAQLRNLRKPSFGSHTVLKERKSEGSGTWSYTLIVNEK